MISDEQIKALAVARGFKLTNETGDDLKPYVYEFARDIAKLEIQAFCERCALTDDDILAVRDMAMNGDEPIHEKIIWFGRMIATLAQQVNISKIIKEQMTDLPVCRLCNANPTDSHTVSILVTCSNSSCPCSEAWYAEKQWRKLMYVPEKKERLNFGVNFQSGLIIGYNTAIDDMLRGGE